MTQTQEGAIKAKQTILRKYGQGFYKGIGTLGGKVGHNGGFGSKKVGKDGLTGRERARKVGSLGGVISRRRPGKHEVVKTTPKFMDIKPPNRHWFRINLGLHK